jgi:hypothetical protein
LITSEDTLKNKTYDFSARLSNNSMRRSSEGGTPQLTATLLPASLKAKMKNLISTIEKEQQQLNKKRT